QSLSSGTRSVLVEGASDGRYLSTGHIVYAVGLTLFAVPTDVQALRILGSPVAMVKDVQHSAGGNTGAAFAAISETGDLVYIPAAPQAFINATVDLDGQLTQRPEKMSHVRISPDGSQIVASKSPQDRSLWIYLVSRHAAPRPIAPDGSSAAWTSDGTRVTYRTQGETGIGIFWKRADGNGPEALL